MILVVTYFNSVGFPVVVVLRIICSCPQFLGEQASNSWSQEERIGITQFAPHRGAEFEARAKCFHSVVFPFVVVLSIPRLVPFVAYSQYTLTITRQLDLELSHRGTTRQQFNTTNIGSSFPS